MDAIQAVHYLGKRVALGHRIGSYSRGLTGLLVSIQAGMEPGAGGEPYATVSFDLLDWSDETNVPLDALRALT